MNALQKLPVTIDYDTLALVHFIINAFLFGICLCRLAAMHRGVILRVRVQYIALLVMSFANGLAPLLFAQWPAMVWVSFSATILYVVWSDAYAWKHGVPRAALKEDNASRPPNPKATDAD